MHRAGIDRALRDLGFHRRLFRQESLGVSLELGEAPTGAEVIGSSLELMPVGCCVRVYQHSADGITYAISHTCTTRSVGLRGMLMC